MVDQGKTTARLFAAQARQFLSQVWPTGLHRPKATSQRRCERPTFPEATRCDYAEWPLFADHQEWQCLQPPEGDRGLDRRRHNSIGHFGGAPSLLISVGTRG